MRITVGLWVVACLLLAGASGYSQTITLSVKNASLKQVFRKIKQQTNYEFVYVADRIANAKPVTFSVTNAPIDQVMQLCLAGQPFKHIIQDGNIVIMYVRGQVTNNDPGPPMSKTIRGRIVNEKNEPVEGATITIKNTNSAAYTNEDGEFRLQGANNAVLQVTSIGYYPAEVAAPDNVPIQIQLMTRASELEQVSIASDGYQKRAPGRETGSVVKINNALLNRKVSFNVLERLDGVTSGLIFNKNFGSGTNPANISIRGVSTIYAVANPLIVVDNFPYDGDISNINPNDIDNITVLKDAAAASIWGAFSGNGVIVITTKKGNYKQPVKVSFNTNVTIGEKPDLYYKQILNSPDYIEAEISLFRKGYYNTFTQYTLVSPVMDILDKQRRGVLSEGEVTAQIDQLKQVDQRREMGKYFYRNKISQQYAINFSGGGENNQYYFSAGYDRDLSSLRGNLNDRLTLNTNNTFRLLKNKLKISGGVAFAQSNATINPTVSSMTFPHYAYLGLVDKDGSALIAPADLRQSYKDTAGGGRLLDWNYRPLDEYRLSNNTSKLTDYRINLGVKYDVLKYLRASIYYQFSKGVVETEDLKNAESYFVRHLVNSYTQVNLQSGVYERAIPVGAILDASTYSYTAHNERAQLDFSNTWNNEHELSVLAGVDYRKVSTQKKNSRTYGYDEDSQVGGAVNYGLLYPLYYQPGNRQRIPNNTANVGTVDHFLSVLANATYTYKQRYAVTASARKDFSNLFGVRTNQKGVPLWSAGLAWEISKEKFYSWKWLPYLKARITDGFNGNIDKSISAFTTARIANNPNPYNFAQASIINPPNEELRWEKIHITNFALEFASVDNRVNGSFEYYLKKGTDLIGFSPIDPTTGVSQFRGNTADIRGKGIDITLQVLISKKPLKWTTDLLLSHVTDKVTNYKVKATNIGQYTNPSFLNPVEGKPLYSLYSFPWGGLDAEGDPQGYLNGHKTKNYAAIAQSADFKNLVYSGPVYPTYFGSFRNTVGWKAWELSWNITYKLGYVFRRNSIKYGDFRIGGTINADYNLRWQKPGDENKTSVPAFVYPINIERESFYAASSALVEKGDHIRLQDIQLSYIVSKVTVARVSISSVKFYLYGNNIGLLWKANKAGLDPDYLIDNFPNPRTYAAGIKIDF
jgi:TonB-linked SusC/RagA family outer membrane protein